MPPTPVPAQPHPPAGPAHSTCTIVPPYLLEALAQSGDPDLEGHARSTLRQDALLRRERHTAEAMPGAAPKRRRRPARDDGTHPARSIHDAKKSRDLPGVKVRGEGEPATDDIAVTEAYDGLGATWELWSTAFGRDSLDGKGLPLVATVHFAKGYDNAFWDGTQMVFGDGDGVIFERFTKSLDVIGHELAHGVTQYTAGLNYQDQSGALNESMSDVFGVLVKQRLLGQSATDADWLIGAELLAPGVKGVAIRSMKEPGTAYDDPRLGKDPQPGHWRDYVDTSDDNGGVHINSGIPNRAFALLAVEVGGFAWERAGQIWVDVLLGDIRADCDFATFAGLTVAAAGARFGADSPEQRAVRSAWDTVGVPYAGDPPAAPRPADASPTAPGPPAAPPEGGSTPPGGGSHPKAPATTEVCVRRTGGFAGRTHERTVVLAELPPKDAKAWQRLLVGPTLKDLARTGDGEEAAYPDAFTYGIFSAHPPVDVTLPEPVLGEDVRRLLDRTLEF